MFSNQPSISEEIGKIDLTLKRIEQSVAKSKCAKNEPKLADESDSKLKTNGAMPKVNDNAVKTKCHVLESLPKERLNGAESKGDGLNSTQKSVIPGESLTRRPHWNYSTTRQPSRLDRVCSEIGTCVAGVTSNCPLASAGGGVGVGGGGGGVVTLKRTPAATELSRKSRVHNDNRISEAAKMARRINTICERATRTDGQVARVHSDDIIVDHRATVSELYIEGGIICGVCC